MSLEKHYDSDDEIMDLVDENDDVIGTVKRGDYNRSPNSFDGYIRCANVFLINRRNMVWVPTRGAHKFIATNSLDFSAGEHVQAGENYIQAAVRGLDEEVGIKTEPGDLIIITVIKATDELPFFDGVFVLKSDIEPVFDSKEFTSARWLDPNELVTMIQKGAKAKRNLLPDLKLVIEKLGL